MFCTTGVMHYDLVHYLSCLLLLYSFVLVLVVSVIVSPPHWVWLYVGGVSWDIVRWL
jgi:hypothetical protein